ncbi:ephrin-A4 [Rhinatrema bivittatum]|uniref:ephrin-A4 n=1 Tax=Rhinatrema bivittatum TaxID=194408 RepID=UPI00112BE7DC|nr:ephrin-A4 [Rhinatrema bivittatum]XP_029436617.1 ephrin-A4 [Rhinatrema bivittatum]
MHWALLWVALACEGLGRGRSLRHAVFWNASNQRFLQEDYAVRVDINDYLDIYCPHYESRVPPERTESFTLFMVDREGYEGCYETSGAFKRWECNKPYAPFGPIKFSEKIQRFTPFSLGFEFRPGEDYYYISAPTKDSAGECLKLLVSVCCTPTTMKPVTEVPRSQPRGRGSGGGTGGGRASGPGEATRTRGSSAPCVEALGWLHVFSLTLLTVLHH